ncbi:MAG: acetyltransferase [Candidatus Bathyarchaeota archaeon]|nr:acetyltransferase [Candidatus Bathyarchaeota archaeon]
MAGKCPKQKLVIIGDGETAELAHNYFAADTDFEVVGFSVEGAYLKKQTLLGLPVVPLESVQDVFCPQTHRAFVAVSFTQLNRLRRRLLNIVKAKGYPICSYISPKAYIGTQTEIGENSFILEGAIIQRGAKLGDNVTIWSGSFIGHRSTVAADCFVGAHVAVSGFCTVGAGCFLGVNSCLAASVKIAENCVIGAGAVVISDTEAAKVYVGNPAKSLSNRSVEDFISGEEAI